MTYPFPTTGYQPPVETDSRNYILEKAQPVQPFPVAYKTDLTALGVYNQMQIPDCVENGVTLVKRYYDYKAGTLLDLCRRWLAILTVKRDGFPISNGTSVENALYVASKQGICESSFLPDDHTVSEATFVNPILTAEATANAATHKIASYAFLSDKSFVGLKNAIYQNGVVVIGLTLDKSWWSDTQGNVTWDASKILPLRIPTDKASLSGHVVVAYAYDETYIYIWNSFGNTWGQEGHGWFGAEYCKYIKEAATVVDLTPEQIQKAEDATQIVNTIDLLQKVENDQNKSLIVSLISSLWAKFLSLWTSTT